MTSDFTINVNAETYTNTHSISLSYNVEPHYSVKMPKVLDVSDNTTVFTYYVKGDIYADQSLQVLFDESTFLIDQNNNSCNVYTSQDDVYFDSTQLGSSYIPSSVTISHEQLFAGVWHGQLNVLITLVGGI